MRRHDFAAIADKGAARSGTKGVFAARFGSVGNAAA